MPRSAPTSTTSFSPAAHSPVVGKRSWAGTMLALATAAGVMSVSAPAAVAADSPTASFRQGKAVQAVPGDEWVYPSVVITNTETRRLGTHRLVIAADDKMHFTDDRLGISRRDGHEEHLTCSRTAENRLLVCDDFNLDLGRMRYVVVYPQMGIDETAPAPATSKVSFSLGTPTFASGKANVGILG